MIRNLFNKRFCTSVFKPIDKFKDYTIKTLEIFIFFFMGLLTGSVDKKNLSGFAGE